MADTTHLLTAIEAALADDWDQSHEIVQALRSPEACWIHAVLHRIEGDLSNAAYWYRLAGREMENGDTKDELALIRQQLTTATG